MPRSSSPGLIVIAAHFSNEQPYFEGQGSRQCDAVVAIRGPPQKNSPRHVVQRSAGGLHLRIWSRKSNGAMIPRAVQRCVRATPFKLVDNPTNRKVPLENL